MNNEYDMKDKNVPTLLFIGDLCGPVEIATTPGFNYVPCIAKPTN